MLKRPDFSTDGCANRHDIAERDAFLRGASTHQKTAHRFTHDDLRSMHELTEIDRALKIMHAFQRGIAVRLSASVSVHESPHAVVRDLSGMLDGLLSGSVRAVML